MFKLKNILLIKSIAVLMSLASFAYAGSVNSIFHNGNLPIAGNPNAKVTIVEFFDYRCSHCATAAASLVATVKSNPNVRAIFVDYPILGSSSMLGARAALAAKKQGKYLEFNHALLASRYISESSIMSIARELGLNTDQLKKDMYSSSVSNQIAANVRLAHSFDVYSTPAFFIGQSNAKNMHNVNTLYGGMSKGEFLEEVGRVGG